MVRLFGTNLPDNKRIEYALTYVYGVGFSRAVEILKAVQINIDAKVKDLKDTDIKKIQDFVEKNYKVEGNLRSEINENIKRLKEISSYKGFRHVRGLPVRGQRTRSNARTRKGKKRTVGSLSKEAWAKLDQVKQTKKVKK